MIYTITATNASGSSTATYTLTVNAVPITATICMVNTLTCHDAAELLGTLSRAIVSVEQGLSKLTLSAVKPNKGIKVSKKKVVGKK